MTLHPNDHVNCSQSSNDVFPTALHMAAMDGLQNRLLPRLAALRDAFARLETRCRGVRKIGRTHLQDAVPLDFADEVSAWRYMLEENEAMLRDCLPYLAQLAIGGAEGAGVQSDEDRQRYSLVGQRPPLRHRRDYDPGQ